MKNILNWTAVALMLSLSAAMTQAEDQAEIPGVGPVSKPVKLFTDFKFTEGPAFDLQGNLYFTDIPDNKIYQVDTKGKLSTFLEPSNHCNGLMLDGADKLLACEMDGRLVSINLKDKKVTPLAPQYKGQRFNAPNDLVIDRTGGIYFTDPHFRAPEPLPQGKVAVYYRGWRSDSPGGRSGSPEWRDSFSRRKDTVRDSEYVERNVGLSCNLSW